MSYAAYRVKKRDRADACDSSNSAIQAFVIKAFLVFRVEMIFHENSMKTGKLQNFRSENKI